MAGSVALRATADSSTVTPFRNDKNVRNGSTCFRSLAGLPVRLGGLSGIGEASFTLASKRLKRGDLRNRALALPHCWG